VLAFATSIGRACCKDPRISFLKAGDLALR
jgi:hypothetical protein